ncbi:STAS domain-containing protein [Halomonas urumqiensis]|uniref:Anti-sigma factor antagonist n=1 Tax=Halomonas urumqiensis TaxID=1684789 RepID=A0A2N7UGD7_9GAMM|nr:STAS domain-containing protein [Halomonas urumqiensis]PMR79475.1 anti-sigma factor antagonist [Halomonas urumqiensis]PTB01402.1 anti-sigma factor antagonist [Halomonas urumqiensis]GHE22510.1 hypothetical protein GCM10017767_30310 [Halomonas urumqiensis]
MTPLLEAHGVRLKALDSCLVVTGEVDFEIATRLAEAGGEWLNAQPAGNGVVFDFTGVGCVSSAALSVLLEWIRRVRAQELELTSVRLSPALRRLTDVAGLDRLLPLESAAA